MTSNAGLATGNTVPHLGQRVFPLTPSGTFSWVGHFGQANNRHRGILGGRWGEYFFTASPAV